MNKMPQESEYCPTCKGTGLTSYSGGGIAKCTNYRHDSASARPATSEAGTWQDSDFLLWIAARLVNHYHENEHTDFVLKLREVASRLAAAQQPWTPDVEKIRTMMMERFSDQLSMEQIASFAYEVGNQVAALQKERDAHVAIMRLHAKEVDALTGQLEACRFLGVENQRAFDCGYNEGLEAAAHLTGHRDKFIATAIRELKSQPRQTQEEPKG